jgi:hypothetical protein
VMALYALVVAKVHSIPRSSVPVNPGRRLSIGRIFGIQTLDHGCCSISISEFSVSALQPTGCSLQATSSYHPQFFAVSFTVTAAPRAISSLSSLSLSASFNRASTYTWSFILLSYESRYISLFILIFVVVIYIYVTNHSIYASQELAA